jgi:hypothetical protein
MNWSHVANLSLADLQARLWPCWMMGKSDAMGWAVPGKGYVRGFGPECLNPVLDRGYTNAYIWRPFSDNADLSKEPIDEDSRVERLVPEADDIGEMMAAYSTTNFLAYLGSPFDHDNLRLWNEGKQAELIDRKRRSALPLINARNCDIGYDHTANLRKSYTGGPPEFIDFSWKWVELIASVKRDHGRRVWLESCLFRDAPHQHAYPFICRTFLHPSGHIQSEWDRSRPPDDDAGGFQDSQWAAPSHWLNGEGLDMDTTLNHHPIETFASRIAKVLARGPQWHWAGGLMYLKAPIESLHRAVVDEATRHIESGDIS